MQPKCQQCDKPAMYQLGNGAIVCLDCCQKIQQMSRAQMADSARMMNYLGESIEYTMGVRDQPPRIQVPEEQLTIQQTTHNHIQVDRSVVGTINTGAISTLNQSLDNIYQNDGESMSQVIKQFTEAFLKDRDVSQTDKEQLLEEIAFLTQQLSDNNTIPLKSKVSSSISAIERIIAASASLVTLWDPINTFIQQHLH